MAFAPIWREKAKVVVSSTLGEADWNTPVVADPADLPALIDEYLIFVRGLSITRTGDTARYAAAGA